MRGGAPSRSVALAGLLVAAACTAAAEPPDRTVRLGTHVRQPLPRDVERVAVGDPGVLGVELLTSRELLALGLRIGRTSVVTWYADGSVEESVWAVERDLSVLAAALREIHPSIRVESAPDRDALILRGTVPDARFARTAEEAARAYVGSGRQPLVRAGGAGRTVTPPAPEAAPGDPGEGTAGEDGIEPLEEEPGPIRAAESAEAEEAAIAGGGGVINLIRVATLPASLESRIGATIAPLGGERVRVRRIVRGETPDDGADVFVLEGPVPNQIALTRILVAASQVAGATGSDVRVLANEAGALGGGGGGGRGGAGGAGGGASGGLSAVSSLGFGSRGGGGAGTGNDLGANVARATALAAGGGRILAFLDVEDLPQVRVAARVLEVSRNRLKSWNPEVNAIYADFDQSPLRRSVTGTRIQGADAPRVGSFGSTDVQTALSLVGGALTQQWQVVVSHFALDALFDLLEQDGVARSLAEPALTVLSGETASFQAGGQIPITVAVDTTTSAVAGEALFSSVVFAEFGVSLAARPLVGEDDMITLDVVPDVSQPDLQLTQSIVDATGQEQSTTAFETRSLRTSARLRDGQALLIGGLLSRSESDQATATPGLHRVPGLGWLAKAVDWQRDALEVVVMVTPSIVREAPVRAGLWVFPDPIEGLDRAVPALAGNPTAAAGTP